MTPPLSPARAKLRRSRLSRCSSDGSQGASLRAFSNDSDCIVEHTIRRYAKFARQCLDGSINKLHRRVATDHGMFLYEEKCETASASSFVHQIYPGGRARSSSASNAADVSQPLAPFTRMTKLYAFGGGEIPGTLDDVMRGVHAETATDHTINCAVQFGVENVLDSGIMESFERRDEAHPYRHFGVKWVEVANDLADDASESSEGSDVAGIPIDELYWIERTGIYTTKSGHKYGYHLFKTVDSDYSPEDPLVRSIQMSVCYLYNQVENDTVHAFTRGIIELPHYPNTDLNDVLTHAGRLMLAPLRARQCQRMRIILEMIEQSKTGRSEMLACRCSKVLKGLPRVDLCSDCREVMQQCKLLSINEAPQRKQAQNEKPRFSSSSSATTNSDRSTESSPSSSTSASTANVKLQTPRGSVRSDGQLVDEIDIDVLSYRMLLPIQEARPASSYRKMKQQRGNVLQKMLLKYEDERRKIASNFIRPGND